MPWEIGVNRDLHHTFYHHTHGETHFRGEISAVRKSTYSVRFPEVGGTWSRPWTVQPNRLFHVAGA